MSLFNSQTIFSLLFTLLVGVALYYYIRYKCRILELNVREQAKVLQSVIMNMNTNNNENSIKNVSYTILPPQEDIRTAIKFYALSCNLRKSISNM